MSGKYRERERLSLKEISNGLDGFLSILDKTAGEHSSVVFSTSSSVDERLLC